MRSRSTTASRSASLRARVSGLVTRQVSEVRSAVTGLGRLQVVLLVVGALTIAYGGLQLLQLLFDGTAPVVGVGGWWLGGPLVVDLIVVPIVVVGGIAIRRIVPSRWRRYVAVASALTLLVTVVAVLFVGGFGRRPDNPSLLDRNYWVGYLSLVAVIWGAPLAARLVRTMLRRQGLTRETRR